MSKWKQREACQRTLGATGHTEICDNWKEGE
jgi:hypothetical protein